MTTRDRSERLVESEWFEQLTGVRSSKRTFYSEYRRTTESLARSIRALESISRALCATTSGPKALTEAVVRAVVDVFGADWVVLAIVHPALPGRTPYLAAVRPDGTPAHRRRDLPAPLAALVDVVARGGTAQPHAEVPLVAPMALDGTPVGMLAAALPGDRAADETDAVVLRTLANQAVVALHNSWLYEESELLRARATASYEQVARQAGELEARNRELQQMHNRLLDAHERQLIGEERNRIARELHDTVAQHVLSIGMNVEWCRALVPEGSPIQERLTLAKGLARDAVERIRSAIFQLSSLDEPAAGGLRGALTRLVESHEGLEGLRVSIGARGSSRPLPPPVEQGLFRIAREAVFNVAAHASATEVRIRLVREPARVRLAVTDNGSGNAAGLRRCLAVALRAPLDGYHRGLANMYARTRELGGELRITRPAGGGVRLSVTVPLPDADATT